MDQSDVSTQCNTLIVIILAHPYYFGAKFSPPRGYSLIETWTRLTSCFGTAHRYSTYHCVRDDYRKRVETMRKCKKSCHFLFLQALFFSIQLAKSNECRLVMEKNEWAAGCMWVVVAEFSSIQFHFIGSRSSSHQSPTPAAVAAFATFVCSPAVNFVVKREFVAIF